MRALSVVRLKYLLLILIAAICMVIAFVPPAREVIGQIFGPRVCHPYDPISDAPDRSRPRRDCLSGRLSYVKWVDESAYSAVDRQTGRWPNDRANRALSIARVDASGTPIWLEQNLLRVDGNRIYWQPPPTDGWTEVVGASTQVVPGQTGALLRRNFQECDSVRNLRTFLEVFLPINLDDLIGKEGRGVQMCYRKAYFGCEENFPTRSSALMASPMNRS
jgi:hypothetical protein